MSTRIHKMFQPAKVGHVGTLDPLATGVLVIAVGNATRLSDRLHELPKSYVGRFRLGVKSDTEDVSGQVTPVQCPPVTYADLKTHLGRLLGHIEQVPPAFSAAKVKGRRAYDLARAGRTVSLQAKSVHVHELELVDTPKSGPLTEFGLRIVCGSGTYIRSLGRDLAIAAGSSAIMTELKRTRLGPFDLSMAVDLESVTAQTKLVDCVIAVPDLDQLDLTPAQVKSVSHGNAIRVNPPTNANSFAMFTPEGRLLAIAEPTDLGLQPRVVLPDAVL